MAKLRFSLSMEQNLVGWSVSITKTSPLKNGIPIPFPTIGWLLFLVLPEGSSGVQPAATCFSQRLME